MKDKRPSYNRIKIASFLLRNVFVDYNGKSFQNLVFRIPSVIRRSYFPHKKQSQKIKDGSTFWDSLITDLHFGTVFTWNCFGFLLRQIQIFGIILEGKIPSSDRISQHWFRYSRTSMARTLMARLQWLFRTLSWVPWKNLIAADLD